MSYFADEARSRIAHLLRMANTADHRERARIIEYANTTPEPPVMDRHGIDTTGCPECRRTMWRRRDADGELWVCASCGHVEEALPVKCPRCQVAMKPPAAGWADRWSCPECPRVAATGESTTEIEDRERARLEAIRLLDEAIALQAVGS
jgi:DNA-directed RNA polymerase subunit M/transcription elongation factor TFIIS